MVQQQMVSTFLVVLLSLVGAGVTTQLEEKSRLIIIAQAALHQDRPTILRDHLNFLWVAGGAILGGYVAVALREVTGVHHVVKYFAVSVATALAVTPYVLVTYLAPCFRQKPASSSASSLPSAPGWRGRWSASLPAA